MHPAIIIGPVRSLIVDVAMGQIPRFTERISSSYLLYLLTYLFTYFKQRRV